MSANEPQNDDPNATAAAAPETSEPTATNVVEPAAAVEVPQEPAATATIPATQPPAADDDDDYGSMEEALGAGAEDFDDLMTGYFESMSELEVGSLTKATVVETRKDFVLLDVGDAHAEGMVPVKEFLDAKGAMTVAAGDVIDVVVEGRDAESGQVTVSYRKARQRTQWNLVVEAFEKQTPLHGTVTRALKNGVLVDVGVPCFLPASQLDTSRVENLEGVVGKDYEVLVIDIDRTRRRAVLSRRKLLLETAKRKKAEVLEGLAEGSIIDGKVKSVLDFGVFVELGGLDGMVPREEVAWEKNVKPSDVLKVGQAYKFVVHTIDREKERVTLSRRRLKPDPWTDIDGRYPIGGKAAGTVINLTNNCAYVAVGEAADGIEGRIHRDNLSWATHVKKPSDLVKKGVAVEAVVLGYDRDRRLLEMGLKQGTVDPWENIGERFPVGGRHTVKIVEFVGFGAFVQIDEHTKGLIHVTDMSWDRNFKDPKKLGAIGTELEVAVLKVDSGARRINFGAKQLTDDPFKAFVAKHKNGAMVTGVVKSVVDFGVFVELAPLVEGMIHISEWDRDKTESLAAVVKPGETISAKILKIEHATQQLKLSRKRLVQDEERKEIEAYTKPSASQPEAKTSLGNLLKGLKIDLK